MSLPFPTPKPNPHKQLEFYRSQLLDLNLRNPLLNFQTRTKDGKLKPNRLELEGQTADALYGHLLEGKAVVFAPGKESAELDEEDGAEFVEGGRRAKAGKNDLVLTLPSFDAKNLEARLRALYRTQQEFIDEQGINCLYLGLGTLSWSDKDDLFSANPAPLVLVPVLLERGKSQGGFRLVYSGEQIEANPALAQLLAQMGITLPSIEEAETLRPSQYAQTVESSVGQKDWTVLGEQAFVGFFFFSKIMMNRDLDPANWPQGFGLEGHPILGPLFVGAEDVPPQNPAAELDQLIPAHQTLHVLDADGSQAVAVWLAGQGRHLVLEGPPGTGKSQTITNLIALLLSQGKRVLFAAEKQAALQVVEARLRQVGLLEACLLLHDRDSVPRKVVEQLRQAMDQPRATPTPAAAADPQSLQAVAEELARYGAAVNTPVGQSGLSPFELYGRLLGLRHTLEGNPGPELKGLSAEGWDAARFAEAQETLAQFGRWLEAHPPQVREVFAGSGRVGLLPGDTERVATEASTTVQTLEAVRNHTAVFGLMGWELPVGPAPLREQLGLLGELLQIPALNGVAVLDGAWVERAPALLKLLERLQQYQPLYQQYATKVRPEAWQQDLEGIRTVLQSKGGGFLAFLNPAVRKARKAFGELFTQTAPSGQALTLKALGELITLQKLETELRKSTPELSRLWGENWQGFGSDVPRLRSITETLRGFYGRVQTGQLSVQSLAALARLADPIQRLQVQQQQHALTQGWGQLEGRLNGLCQFLEVEPQTVWSLNWDELSRRLHGWATQAPALRARVEWNQWAKRLETAGLEAMLGAANQPAAPKLVGAWFEQHLLRRWLEQAFVERPALAGFSSSRQTDLVERFAKLDERLIELNRLKVLGQYRQTLPAPSGAGQMGVLQREFGKKTRFLSIRDLMTRAGRAVQSLKPVFMMSPLSISNFLPLGSVEFDVVIFDEASQVRPADAMGALLRAKQAVVVGDSNQLGPTNFFARSNPEEDMAEEGEEADGSESLLELFEGRLAGHKHHLGWHYRSRHESLISTSNQVFYENRLTTFPSASASSARLGLVYHYLPHTAYEAGERKRINPLEAEAVVEAVIQHARHNPHESLAVVTFNLSQKRLIENLLENRRDQLTDLEGFLFPSPEKPERFVVKNIENVQGDERDVIMISVGSGRDSSGAFHRRFGPINSADGWRRINVLITRARTRCEVFCNFKPQELGELSLEEAKKNGLYGFQQFLKRAWEATQPQGAATNRVGSDLAHSIGQALEARGYTVEAEVGGSEMCIDLAVKTADGNGYLLGIQLDGPHYHRASWSRERERLREQVLRGLGWRLHRVWSTDWFRDPAEGLERLVAAIEEARKGSTAPTQAPSPSAPPEPAKPDPQPTQTALPNSAPRPSATRTPYQTFEKRYDTKGVEFYQLGDQSVLAVALEALKQEGILHRELLTRRLANATGNSRVGSRIEAKVRQALQYGVTLGVLKVEEDFVFSGDTPVVLRDRSGLSSAERRFEYVPPAELDLAIVTVVKQSRGIALEEMVGESVRLLGFERVTEEAKGRVMGRLPHLMRSSAVSLQGDFVMAK